ncbi:MAG: hypothetical protein ABH821_00720 [archaeon]
MKKNLLILMFLCLLIFSVQAAKTVNLTVTEQAGVNRTEVVSNGVPFAQGDLTSLDNLKLKEGITELPLQARSLAVWPDRSYKWILIDFPIQLNANASKNLTLEYGSAISSNAAPENAVNVNETPNNVTVDNGLLEIVINKNNFNLFDSVKVDGLEIISSNSKNGPHILGIDELETDYFSSNDSSVTVELEEEGPIKTVLKINGTHKANNGSDLKLDFTVRITVFANSKTVKVYYTLENTQCPLGVYLGDNCASFFKELNLENYLNLNETPTIKFNGYSDSSNSSYSLYQNNEYEDSADGKDFYYNIKKGTNQVSSGEKYDGWVNVKDNEKGLMVGVRNFWQKYPNKLTFSEDNLKIGFWPRESSGPYLWLSGIKSSQYQESETNYVLPGARTTRNELIYVFQSTSDNVNHSNEMKKFNNPLLAVPAPSYTIGTNAVFNPTLERLDWEEQFPDDPELVTALNRMERFNQMNWDASVTDIPANSSCGIEPFGQRNFWDWMECNARYFGWSNFGDIPWSEGFSSLHYDWTHGSMANFYRTNDYELFLISRELAEHRFTIDQFHNGNLPRRAVDGFAGVYEKGYWHGDYKEPNPSHTWIQGLLEYYVLTGDEEAREAATLTGDNYLYTRYWTDFKNEWGDGPGDYACNPETRVPAWSIEAFTEMYFLTADSKYLEMSEKIIDSVIECEQEDGGQGFILYDHPNEGSQSQAWMHALLVQAIGKHQLARLQASEYGELDSESVALMKRISDWLLKGQKKDANGYCLTAEPLIGPHRGGCFNPANPEEYKPLQTVRRWAPDRIIEDASQVTHISYFIDAFAFTYYVTSEQKYLDEAKEHAIDYYKYYQVRHAPGYTYHPEFFTPEEESYSDISFKLNTYPGTESKNLGWARRAGIFFLSVLDGITPLQSCESDLGGYCCLNQQFCEGEDLGYSDCGTTCCSISCSSDTTPPEFNGLDGVRDEQTGGSLTLSWQPAIDDYSDTITYKVYLKTNGNYDFGNPSYTTTNTNLTVNNLENFELYYFVVRAVDEAGNEENNLIERPGIPTPEETQWIVGGTNHPNWDGTILSNIEIVDGKARLKLVEEGIPGTPDDPYIEDFEGYSGDETGEWVDTSADYSLTIDDELFKITSGQYSERQLRPLGSSNISNAHSHYEEGLSWSDYTLEAELWYYNPNAGVGATFFSQYPNTDAYYALITESNNRVPRIVVRNNGETTDLSCSGTTSYTTSTDDGFLIKVEVKDEAGSTVIKAKVWNDSADEPETWEITCSDSSSNRLTTGTIGTWVDGSDRMGIDDITVTFDGSEEGTPSEYASTGIITSPVFNTSEFLNASWQELDWIETLPSGTSVSFEVRGSNNIFQQEGAASPWITVSGKPVTDIPLPTNINYREVTYIQWRAILSTDNTEITPELSSITATFDSEIYCDDVGGSCLESCSNLFDCSAYSSAVCTTGVCCTGTCSIEQPPPSPPQQPPPGEIPPTCGNGIIDSGENCSNCPTDYSCSGNTACCNTSCETLECLTDSDCEDYRLETIDVCQNKGTCNATCTNTTINTTPVIQLPEEITTNTPRVETPITTLTDFINMILEVITRIFTFRPL